jgi:hypothetical protein
MPLILAVSTCAAAEKTKSKKIQTVFMVCAPFEPNQSTELATFANFFLLSIIGFIFSFGGV